jgi:hypothetical protein
MTDEQGGAGAATDAERARAIREQLKSLHAFDLAYETMISLVSFGYQKMGLTDETRDLRDLGDARLAIELLRANLEVVEREQGAERTRDVRSTLAQMQLGYAQAVQLAGSASPPVAASAEGSAVASESPDDAAKPPQDPVGKQPATKKPAAKKAAAKKPAAKKPVAKKPAAKKPRGGSTPPAA